MALSPGDSLDHYVIEALLGEGGMGVVYRAFDTRIERRVALKILRPSSEGRPKSADGLPLPPSDGPAKLLREARAAAALDHPNASAIFDVGDVGGVSYIAMELVEGRSLRSYIGDRGVPFDRRIRWLVDIGNALAAAHARGLVHRDVKPENVIIRADGVVKVLDFGIARRVVLPNVSTGPNTDGTYATLTEAGLVLGTPHYMAPEQLRGEPVDGRADQFSWGVVGYELLTGRLPWSERATGVALVSEILSKDPLSMRTFGAAVPSAAEATIRKALGKLARDRFATIEDAVSGLEPYVAPGSRDFRTLDSTEPPPPLTPIPTGPATYPTSGSLPGPSMVSAGQNSPMERTARRPVALVWGAGLIAAVAVAYFVAVPSNEAPHAVASAPPSAAPSTAPTAITDVAPPRAAGGEAAAAYLAGVQSLRDASLFAAVADLTRATMLDRSLGAGHLRLAWLLAIQSSLASARAELRLAADLSTSLSPRDRTLLAALEPFIAAQPSDVPEAERRLSVASAATPGDAEVAFLLSRVRIAKGDPRGANAALDLAGADDPSFATVAWARGVDAEDAGDSDGAFAAYTRCLEISSSAASCLRARSILAAQRGDCAAVESDARRMLAVEPSGWRAYESLARALVARKLPVDTVREALKREWLFLPGTERARREQIDEARLAILQGDFEAARARVGDLQKLGDAVDADAVHVDPAELLVAIDDEIGDARRAGTVAHDAITTRDASRVSPALLSTAAHAGLLSNDDFEARRGAWIDRARGVVPAPKPGDVWLTAYALPAQTADDANAALSALAGFAPSPHPRDVTPVDALLGKVYLLAGLSDDAIPPLRRATAACIAFDDPLAHTRAFADLGHALEARGDTSGACDAYATVLARWGHATPRSVTASAVAARSRKLACAKP